MLLYITIIILILSSIVAYFTANRWSLETEYFVSSVIAGLSGIILFCALIRMGITYTHDYNVINIRKNSLQFVLDMQRKAGNAIENAAISKDIYEFNTELAMYKYRNSGAWLGIFYDDKVLTIQPVK